jgi:hypothetical protein
MLAAMMVPVQIVMPPELLAWLRSEAKRRGIAVSDLVRRIVDAAKDRPCSTK